MGKKNNPNGGGKLPAEPTVGAEPTPEQTPAPVPTVGAEQTPAEEPKAFATFPDQKAFDKRMDREARRRMNEAAKAAGFDDWQHMIAETGERTPQGGKATGGAAPKPEETGPTADSSEADRLRTALHVGQELNLPAALIGRLQGSTPEEMKADAEALLTIMGPQRPAGPGIPPVREGNQPTTFTRAQLQDPAFVREHAAEIRKANSEGRIVDS